MFSIPNVVVTLSYPYSWKNISEVIMEEQGSSGAQDSAPMTLHEAMVMMEKRGMIDLKVSGHSVERPAAVKRGDEPDTLEVSHQSYLVFKPNPVTVKNVKGSNIAGFVGFKVLSSSRFLKLVWSSLLTYKMPLHSPCVVLDVHFFCLGKH